jgi:formylglycine-generating enzyme required for sulfatase activity
VVVLAAAIAVPAPAGGRAYQEAGTPDVRGQAAKTPRLRPFRFEIVTLDGEGRPSSSRKSTGRSYVEVLGDGVTLEMVEIPAGTFLMGTSESERGTIASTYERMGRSEARASKRAGVEAPQHSVTVRAYFMARFEVTQAQWRTVAAMPHVERGLDANPSECAGDDRPVESVSWDEATEFCARLSRATGRAYRLPSEAEWEYACRAGTTTPFHFGQTISTTVANYWGDPAFGGVVPRECREETLPVGALGKANAFGLSDMHGNVAEWCLDTWHPDYHGAPADGRAWGAGPYAHLRVVRGGSWYDLAVYCRSAARLRHKPEHDGGDTGFRVVVERP